MTADFSSDTMDARRQQNNIFKVLKGKEKNLRILYSEKKVPLSM